MESLISHLTPRGGHQIIIKNTTTTTTIIIIIIIIIIQNTEMNEKIKEIWQHKIQISFWIHAK
jgi:hypothetical protein